MIAAVKMMTPPMSTSMFTVSSNNSSAQIGARGISAKPIRAAANAGTRSLAACSLAARRAVASTLLLLSLLRIAVVVA